MIFCLALDDVSECSDEFIVFIVLERFMCSLCESRPVHKQPLNCRLSNSSHFPTCGFLGVVFLLFNIFSFLQI